MKKGNSKKCREEIDEIGYRKNITLQNNVTLLKIENQQRTEKRSIVLETKQGKSRSSSIYI